MFVVNGTAHTEVYACCHTLSLHDALPVDHGLEIIHERAVITGPNAVKLASGRTVTARYILVAVGAWPVVTECEGNELGITSNEVFHLETLPKRVVIACGGYIAYVFAGIFHDFGSQVTIVNRTDKILRGYDEQHRARFLPLT